MSNNKVFKNFKDPLVIGIIIFVSLILLSLMVFYAGDYSLRRGFYFSVLFSYSDGVLKNTPVNISGVNYGNVNDIKIVIIDDKPYVKMDIRLLSDAVIFNDARVFISTVGFLGEKIIEIEPGSSTSGKLEKGETLRGVDPVRTTEMVEKVFAILKNTDKIVSSVTEIFYTEETKQQFMVILENLTKSSERIDNIIAENQITLKRSIDNIENTTENLVSASSNVNNVVSASEPVIMETLNNLKSGSLNLLSSVNEVNTAVPVIVNDLKVSANNIKGITEETNVNLNNIMNNFNLVSQNVKQLSEDMKDPDNNIGSFIYSKEIYDNVFSASQNIKKTTEYIKYNPWVLFRSRTNPLTEDDFK